jgi:hypothetical protein
MHPRCQFFKPSSPNTKPSREGVFFLSGAKIGLMVFLASRDGWISKFDIYNLKTVAEIRAGINPNSPAMVNMRWFPSGRTTGRWSFTTTRP